MTAQQNVAHLFLIHQCAHGLNAKEIDAIAAVGKLRHYAAGERAVGAGDKIESMSLIVNGLFALTTAGDDKKRFGYLGPNEQFGALEIIQDEEATADITAIEPTTVIEFECHDAQRLMNENKVFSRNLLRKASANMTRNAIDGGRSHRSQRVAFVHLRDETQSISRRIQLRLCQLGEDTGRIANREVTAADRELSTCPTLDVTNDPDAVGSIRKQLADWSQKERIVFDINFHDVGLDAESFRRLLSFPERVYLLVQPETAPEYISLVEGIMAENPEWCNKLNLVWVLGKEHHVAPFLPSLTKHFKRTFKVKTAGTDETFFQSTATPGIERVIHDLRGLRIGLALGGGAARGMSHLGVLKAFDEHGIVVDGVAGTSVGAMMGVTYCCGYSPDNGVERFTNALTPSGMFKLLGDKMYMLYKYRSNSWDGMLRPHFFDWKLEQMLVPLTTIAADLVSAEEFVRESGDAVTGILESINLGGISVPICRDGKALVDGGYLNNVPADTLVRQGHDFVISVDVTKSIAKKFGVNTPETPTEQMKAPRLRKVLSRIREVAQKNLSLMGAAHADFSIAPPVGHIDFADFKSTPSTAQIGYDAAMEALPLLKKRLNRLDPQLFPILGDVDGASRLKAIQTE